MQRVGQSHGLGAFRDRSPDIRCGDAVAYSAGVHQTEELDRFEPVPDRRPHDEPWPEMTWPVPKGTVPYSSDQLPARGASDTRWFIT